MVAALDEVGVSAVDAQFRRRLRIQFHLPTILLATDQNVRDDVLRRFVVRQVAGVGRQRTDDGDGPLQFVLIDVQPPLDGSKIPVRQWLQVVGHDEAGGFEMGRIRGQGLQLQGEAFRRIARGDADGVETLDPVQYGFDFLGVGFHGLRQGGEQIGHGGEQVAVGFQGVEDHLGDEAVLFFHGDHFQLLAQMRLQALAPLGAGDFVVIGVVFAAGGSGI